MYKENGVSEIIKEIDNIYGAEKCKEILKNYATYIELNKSKKGNYNVYINNKSECEYSEKVILIIETILLAKGIITETRRYLKKEHLRKEKGEYKRIKEIKEKLIIIDDKKLNIGSYCLAEDVREILEEFPDKIFIVIGNYLREGDFESEIGNLIIWSMAIEQLSDENKQNYITNYLKYNKIKLATRNTFVNTLSREPFWKIKNELLNITLECKAKGIKTINDNIIKKELKKKYYSNREIKEKKKVKGLQELNTMVGMSEVKDQVEKIVNFIKINRDRKNLPALHMCFTGNPGTGKTTVARILGKVFAEKEILSDCEKFVEIHGRDLVGQYVGWTAQETKRHISRAEGGILFIDEAYSLNSDRRGCFEDEAIATLIKEMEDKRDKVCIILAGYQNEMKELIKRNPGFESRIQFYVNFPDYTEEELYKIFKSIAKEDNYTISNNIKQSLIEYFSIQKLKPNFANGRCVRNIFEKIKFEQANRVAKEKNTDINLIKKCDIENVLAKELPEEVMITKRQIGF